MPLPSGCKAFPTLACVLPLPGLQCGHRCPDTSICHEGRCACPRHTTLCQRRCVRNSSPFFTTDTDCGRCGNSCARGKSCQRGHESWCCKPLLPPLSPPPSRPRPRLLRPACPRLLRPARPRLLHPARRRLLHPASPRPRPSECGLPCCKSKSLPVPRGPLHCGFTPTTDRAAPATARPNRCAARAAALTPSTAPRSSVQVHRDRRLWLRRRTQQSQRRVLRQLPRNCQ